MRFDHEHFIMVFLSLVALASGGDLFADLSQGASGAHLVQEAFLLGLALLILARLLWENRNKARELVELKSALEEIGQMPPPPPEVFEARHRLGEVIVAQFEQWQLSKSEQEVGLMLLKGYSLKEIALLRGTAEKTIRQQASAVYQKSGVSGRHAFSAWFIEDLL